MFIVPSVNSCFLGASGGLQCMGMSQRVGYSWACTHTHTHTHTPESGLQCMGMSQRVGHSWACTLTHRAECTHTHTLNSSPCPVTFHPYVVSLNSTSHAWVTGMSWLPPNYIIFLLVLWLSSQSCLTLMLPTYILLFLLWFSRQVISDSSRPHGLQHARLPCPLPPPGLNLYPTYNEMLSPPF